MKPYLIKVDMKDMWEFTDTRHDAFEMQRQLEKQHPGFYVGVYQLLLASAAAEVKA